MKKYIIAIDFDGTIVQHKFPDIGIEAPLAFHYMSEFEKAGAKLILWTMRSDSYLDEAVEYCHNKGIQFWAINENPEQHIWTSSPKVYAKRYIDDAAVGIPLIDGTVDWSVVGPMVLKEIKERL